MIHVKDLRRERTGNRCSRFSFLLHRGNENCPETPKLRREALPNPRTRHLIFREEGTPSSPVCCLATIPQAGWFFFRSKS